MSSNLKIPYGVGYKGSAEEGETFEVVRYEGRKKITIRFTCGLEKNTTSTQIKQGKVKYKKKTPKYEVGDIVVNKKGVQAEIISLDRRRGRVKLKFENDNVKNYAISCLGSKDFTDEDLVKIKIGDTFPTANFGDVKVTSYESAHKITVKFDDGVETTCQASSLRLGNIGHPMSGLHIGYRFTNNEGFSAEVVDYISPLKVKIKWDEGGITEAIAANIKSGGVYYPNHKSICGVGYFGIGFYKPNKAGKGSNYKQRVYDSWQRMIRRCYDEKEQLKPTCKAYIGVEVCDEWHNFQNFAVWAEDRIDKFEPDWDLDKDMFGDGWLYSPETCTMLPSKVNWFLCDTYSNKQSGLPDGVNIIKPKTANSKVGYVARCHVNGKREYLGFFNTSEEAGKVYREAKEGEAKRLATEYRDILTDEQYEYMLNFKLEDIHRKSVERLKGNNT